MTIDNSNVRPLRKRLYLPVAGMNGYQVVVQLAGGTAAAATKAVNLISGVLGKEEATAVGVLGGTAASDTNISLRSLGHNTSTTTVTGARLSPISTLNMSGLLCGTASATVASADGVEFCGMIPYDLDRTRTVGVRVWWTSEAAAVSTRSVTWAANYKKFTLASATGASTAGALAVAATALTTTIAAQAPAGTTLTLQRTSRGIVAANAFTKLDAFWSWAVTMASLTAFTEAKYLLGMELDYVPRVFSGRRATFDGDTTELLGS